MKPEDVPQTWRRHSLYFVSPLYRSNPKSKSLYFSIPAWLRGLLDLKEHDIVKVTIEKVMEASEK